VKGLHSLSRIRPLPTKEREQYDNARHLLVHEIAVSLAVPPALAEDFIDYALMPPAGVTFKLKPPPKPVQLPVRPRRRIVRPSEEEDDLGLDSLGIDLGTGSEVELPAAGLGDLDVALPPVEGVEGVEPVEGAAGDELGAASEDDEGEGEDQAEGDEEEVIPVPARAEKRGARAKEAPAPVAKKAAAPPKPAAKMKAERRPEKPSKAEKPAKAVKPAKPEKAEKVAKAAPAKAAAKPVAKKAAAPKAKPAAPKKPEKAAKKPARGGSRK
jgi:hypothetical protein